MSDRQAAAFQANAANFAAAFDQPPAPLTAQKETPATEHISLHQPPVEPHRFQPGTAWPTRYCRKCGWVEDAYVHASEEDRRAFDAARKER